jgi:hypothetical protein
MNTLNPYTRTNWLPKHSGNPAYMEHINDLIKKINEIITDDTTDNASLSGDNTFAGSNTFTENIQFAAGAYGVTALAGGGQTGATLLTGMFSSIAVCATNGDSCILPAAVAGNFMIVATSEVVAGTPQIFPAVGEQIDTMGANVPLTVTSGTVVMFSCDTDGNWVSTSLYDINHIYNAINTAKAEVRPYDVYVALLTQTTVSPTSGLLVVGKTYKIDTLVAGDDFANVGYVAPSTPFVATGTTPTTWTNSTEVINITDSAPIAIELENDFNETLTYEYIGAGTYSVVSPGSIFAADKTASRIAAVDIITPGIVYVSTSHLAIKTTADGILNKSMLEIRIYP